MKKSVKILIAVFAVVLAAVAAVLLFLPGENTEPEKPGLTDPEKAKLEAAMLALEDSSWTGLDLLNRIYIHAFSVGNFISANITENTLEELAAGSASDTVKAMVISEKSMQTGDILLVDDQVYLYGPGGLWDANATGLHRTDTGAVLLALPMAKQYAALRPACVMTLEDHGDPAAQPDTLNEYQQAIVATARAFLLRGEKLQYADTRLVEYGSKTGATHRWHLRTNSPEDCTDQNRGYTNCAVFCHDVYYQALGYILPDKMYTTANMAKYAATNGTQVFCYERAKGTVQSEEEKTRVEQEFLAALQPGDVIVIRREDNSGHALLYVGNGDIIHSSGSIYNYEEGVEKYEASIRQTRAKDYFFNPTYSPRGYVFTNAVKLVILRPLNIFDGEIPAQTQNRVQNMQGIMAQKLCSHTRSQTVAPGEQITFTYEIYNANTCEFTDIKESQVTLEISEDLPAELELISGCDNVNGSRLTWSVTLAAGERIHISYTAKVKADTPAGRKIRSEESTVGGVTVNCPPVTVGNTLTGQQQKELVSAALSSDATGFGLINKLYGKAIFDEDFDAVFQGVFTQQMFYNGIEFLTLDETGKYTGLVAPGLYGGYHLWTPEYVYDRTHLPREQDLQTGDVLLCKTGEKRELLLWLGEDEGFLNADTLQKDEAPAQNRLAALLSADYFAVLRPSLANER